MYIKTSIMSQVVDLIVLGNHIRIFLKGYNKLCSPLLRILNMLCFSVKINKLLIPGKYES